MSLREVLFFLLMVNDCIILLPPSQNVRCLRITPKLTFFKFEFDQVYTQKMNNDNTESISVDTMKYIFLVCPFNIVDVDIFF
jgi:hypothetical protein